MYKDTQKNIKQNLFWETKVNLTKTSNYNNWPDMKGNETGVLNIQKTVETESLSLLLTTFLLWSKVLNMHR